jgi:hypothetical protein
LADVAPRLPQARQEDYWPVSDAELAEFQRRFEERNTPAARAAHMRRELRCLLSRRARFRLWRDDSLTSAGIWLADHVGERACVALWRATGLWSGR